MRYMGSQEPYVEVLFVQASSPNPSRIGFLNKQRPFLAFLHRHAGTIYVSVWCCYVLKRK